MLGGNLGSLLYGDVSVINQYRDMFALPVDSLTCTAHLSAKGILNETNLEI